MDRELVNQFVVAARYNDISRINMMLAITPQIINEKNIEDGSTALFWACREGHASITNLLLNHGANPNIVNKIKNTALFWASRLGQHATVSLLLDREADPNIRNKHGFTALMEACSNGHISVAELLLNSGADPNVQNKFGDTPLTKAAHDDSMVQLLLYKGANPNFQNKFGVTALMEASGKGYISVAEILLNNGANPNVQSNFGDTALTMAAHNDSMVQLLLSKGANPNFQNKFGVTALMKSISQGNNSIARLLLNQLADPNLQDENGYTALVIASSNGQTSMVELLLEYGANITIETNHGETAYDLARNEETRCTLRLFMLRQSLNAHHLRVIHWSDITIIERISASHFSSVYRGIYRGTDVAIKMLRGDGAMQLSPDDMREIEVLSNLRHPRIVSLLGVILDLPDDYDSTVGLVTEFMPRGSLYDVLHLNTTPPEHRLSTLSSKLRVLRDVADGMRFLHMSNVIHRDLTSSNVLLDEDGRAKICDCGMSMILPPDISYTTAVVGTAAWSSPESLLDDAGTVRQSSDVYSFGVIMWEMLTNSIPWNGLSPVQIGVRLSTGESLPLSPIASTADIPPELVVMLEQCLSRNPDDRPTFEHIVQCLSDILPACIEREGRVPCPNAYLCPISHEIMEDPVICCDGHTYDRVNIEQWLQHNDTSPLTNAILEDKTLRPNIVLREIVKRFSSGIISSNERHKQFTVINSRDVAISHCISSSVYRGQYQGTDVAIKMLRGGSDMQISADVMREIAILSNLHHTRVVSPLGVIFDLEDRYGAMAGLVTEYMSRGSLYDVLHLNTAPPEHRISTLSSKLRVLRDVADGMRFLHMSNVIHGDLKSPNVLLDEDGRAKICDFGKSQFSPPNISYATAAVGTPAWSSPESLLLDGTVRQSSDVYSFGVILWEILTNSIPWNGLSASSIIVRVSRGESLPLDAVASIADIPSELVAMLEQCLSRSPEHRPTFENIVQCLSDVLPACIETEGRVPCPNAYLCPISHYIMDDPVICSDGHTYDRVNIEQWLQHNDTSPLTNMILDDKTLRPNIVLREMIREFREANA